MPAAVRFGPFVRAAGVGLAPPDGALITWTVAEGRRGRRWRSVHASGGLGVLLETDGTGRPVKLEVSSPAGLASLHPEGPDVHGNAASADGVHPIHLRAGNEVDLDAANDPLATTALLHAASGTPIGAWFERLSVVVTPGLSVSLRLRRYRRLSTVAWLIVDRPGEGRGPDGRAWIATVDEDGLPLLVGRDGGAASIWPLDEVSGVP